MSPLPGQLRLGCKVQGHSPRQLLRRVRILKSQLNQCTPHQYILNCLPAQTAMIDSMFTSSRKSRYSLSPSPLITRKFTVSWVQGKLSLCSSLGVGVTPVADTTRTFCQRTNGISPVPSSRNGLALVSNYQYVSRPYANSLIPPVGQEFNESEQALT